MILLTLWWRITLTGNDKYRGLTERSGYLTFEGLAADDFTISVILLLTRPLIQQKSSSDTNKRQDHDTTTEQHSPPRAPRLLGFPTTSKLPRQPPSSASLTLFSLKRACTWLLLL